MQLLKFICMVQAINSEDALLCEQASRVERLFTSFATVAMQAGLNPPPKVNDLTLSKPYCWFLFFLAERGPIRNTQIAECMGVDASTASRHLKALARARLIEKEADPQDGRAQLVKLSNAGMRITNKLIDQRREVFRSALSSLDSSERMALLEIFDKLARRFSSRNFKGFSAFLNEDSQTSNQGLREGDE